MNKHKTLKLACYISGASMAVVTCLSPLLFLTFRDLYGISYSLLGLLVVVNFSTQLLIDLAFSFFSKRFNIPFTVMMMPVLSVVGFLVYALSPFIFGEGNVYIGLVIGTLIFSASSGLGEVLTSPIISTVPSENPERQLSRLHSMYAFGVVGVVIFSTLFLLLFGGESWWILTLILIIPAAVSGILFFLSDIPDLNEGATEESGGSSLFKKPALYLSFVGIFLGGAAECTMSQWASGYLEAALGIPKVWGDVFGVALFGLALGFGRTLYAKIGKNAPRALFLGAIGSTLCYLAAAVSPFPIIGLVGCACTGFTASMLWPGSLIISSERFPKGGVVMYALMAAGGDLGASVGPWAVGLVADLCIASPAAAKIAETLSLTSEQLGMKLGLLIGMLFPLFAIFIFAYLWRKKTKNPEKYFDVQ
jgi:fucose permease